MTLTQKSVQHRELLDHAYRLFDEVEKWGLVKPKFCASSSPGTYYVEIQLGKLKWREWVEIRISEHPPMPWRQQQRNKHFLNIEDYKSDADCLAEARRLVEEILARQSAH